MTLERFERLRCGDYWREASSGRKVFFPAHLAYYAVDGLGVYDLVDQTWEVFHPVDVAVHAGSYVPDPQNLLNVVRTVTIGAGRVWMGTAGVGLLARDLRTGAWSRYDVKADVMHGIHMFVLYADDEYVFAMSGGPSQVWQNLPDVKNARQLGPALEVHSLRRNGWLRVRAIPIENVLEFGWTDAAHMSVPCDTRRFAQGTLLPLELCTWPHSVEPSSDWAGYLLGRDFAEPGASLRFLLRKSELDRAFASLQ